LGLGNIVKIKPPLVINEKQVERVLEIFGSICEDAAKRR
jgi:4-aminobutyrate aminotransferase-like enzyme